MGKKSIHASKWTVARNSFSLNFDSLQKFRQDDTDWAADDSDVEIDLSAMAIETIVLSDDDSHQPENSSSGTPDTVKVTDACKIVFEEIRKRRQHRYVVFRVRNQKQIVVDVIGDRYSTYDRFLTALQKGGPGECRFGLYDFEYSHNHQGSAKPSKKEKMFLIFWCPEAATPAKKTLYDNSFVLLRNTLVGVQKYFYVTELSEASSDSIEKRLREDDRV